MGREPRGAVFATFTMSSMGPDLPDGAGELRLPDLGMAKMRERLLTPPLVAPDTPRPRAAGSVAGSAADASEMPVGAPHPWRG